MCFCLQLLSDSFFQSSYLDNFLNLTITFLGAHIEVNVQTDWSNSDISSDHSWSHQNPTFDLICGLLRSTLFCTMPLSYYSIQESFRSLFSLSNNRMLLVTKITVQAMTLCVIRLRLMLVLVKDWYELKS